MTPTTLVARDAEGAQRVATWLRAHGEPALACPVLETAIEGADAVLPEVADLLVTSARGAAALAWHVAQRPGRADGWRILALDGATAAALRRHDLAPARTSDGGAAALAAQAQAGCRGGGR